MDAGHFSANIVLTPSNATGAVECSVYRGTRVSLGVKSLHGFDSRPRLLFSSEESPRVKPLLYTYPVLLTGIHLMRSGEL
jgi:hypothetical protein